MKEKDSINSLKKYISKTQVFDKQKTVLLPLLRKAMAHENTALFHLDSDGSKKDII